jgi:hypothetical protein
MMDRMSEDFSVGPSAGNDWEHPWRGYTKAALLDAAKETVAGRGKNYGKPEDNFGRIAAHWTVYLKNRHGVAVQITPGDVAALMVLMKIARLEFDPKHADSWVDTAGYAACGAEIETAK